MFLFERPNEAVKILSRSAGLCDTPFSSKSFEKDNKMIRQENYNRSTSTVEELTQKTLNAIPEMTIIILNSVMQTG